VIRRIAGPHDLEFLLSDALPGVIVSEQASAHADSATEKVTEVLCAFIATTQFSDLPASVVEQAQRGLLDWIGCALAGSRDAALEPTIRVMFRQGGRPEATVLGRNKKLGLLNAALINGQMGNVIDYDDTYNVDTTMIHTSSPVLPGLLGLAESRKLSGKDLLNAYVLGFEAGARVGHSAPLHLEGGWHLMGTLGTIAAGAAAGKLIGLSSSELVHAVAISATQAAGMSQNRGTLCKSFHAGRAAMSGVLSALLAAEGFDSATDIIEGKYGFCRTYSAVAKPEVVVQGLGEKWAILKNTYKPYACAVVLHPAIDGILSLRESCPVAPEEVQKITLKVHPHVTKINAYPDPATGLQAKINVSHCVALAFIDGACGATQFEPGRTGDPKVIALRRKVELIADPSLSMHGASVELVLRDGIREVFIEQASGTLENPMTDAALERKFLLNAAPTIGDRRAQQVVEMVRSLSEVSDASKLTRLLA